MYTFYILFSSARNKYYVGHTGDRIEEGLRNHNSNHTGYTGKVRDWEIVYTELYHLKEEAYRRERGSRDLGINPTKTLSVRGLWAKMKL